MGYRYSRILRIRKEAASINEHQLGELLKKAQGTLYGRNHSFNRISNYNDYVKACPLTEYNSVKNVFREVMDGHDNLIWPGSIDYFSKSSGTTEEKSKYLPVSKDLIFQNLRACGWDGTSVIYNHQADANIFGKKNLLMGGSLKKLPNGKQLGDISAIMVDNLPEFTKRFYAPDIKISLMDDWEEKIELMAQQLVHEEMYLIGGVPTWVVVLFRRLLELSGANNICELWPDLKLYAHGGVGFDPYINQFKEFLPSPNVDYMEIYNASEGYFGMQDDFNNEDLLLLTGNGIFYEFIEDQNINVQNPETISLQDISLNTNYEIVISTVAGLWRYRLGDTIRFTSKDPYRFKITGRTKQFINTFGEEVMISDTDKAISLACNRVNARVNDYTVAPVFMQTNTKGGHEWIIEFEKEPTDMVLFQKILDDCLQEVNSDYQAKRYKDMALENLKIHKAPQGVFESWLRKKGKLGGQNKIPRLSPQRNILEEIKQLIKTS